MWTVAGVRLLDMDDLRMSDLLVIEQAVRQYEEVMRDGGVT
jgi:hypothetical protein